MGLPECASHIRTRVPRDEVVANSLPDAKTVKVVSAVVCAAMNEAGFLVGRGGGALGSVGDGGDLGAGGRQGGR